MAIKNKDGSEYYFSKPNPIVISQNTWPKDEPITLEGTFGKRYILDIKQNEVEAKTPTPTPTRQVLIQDKPLEEPEEIKIIAKKQEEEMFIKPGGVIDVWCLPAISTNESKVNFGNKFTLKGKIYDSSNDFYIQVITRQPLSANSIIYPMNNDRRWWQVSTSHKMKEEGFYLVSAVMSDYQPDFSD